MSLCYVPVCVCALKDMLNIVLGAFSGAMQGSMPADFSTDLRRHHHSDKRKYISYAALAVLLTRSVLVLDPGVILSKKSATKQLVRSKY